MSASTDSLTHLHDLTTEPKVHRATGRPHALPIIRALLTPPALLALLNAFNLRLALLVRGRW